MSGPALSDEERNAVLLDVRDGVAVITLNRPDRLNAVDATIRAAFPARLEEAADREDVRVIVLTGAGRGFCAGADLAVIEDLGAGRPASLPGRRYLIAKTIPKPVIGVVNGPCAGIGLVFALACDIRFASPETRFTTSFARRGLVAEQGLAWLLSDLLGPARALDLLFTSRTVDGEQALRLGLVEHLHPAETLLPQSIAYARELAESSSAVSMGIMKWQVQRARETSLWQALDDAAELTTRSFAGRDFVTVGARLRGDPGTGFPPLPPGRRLGTAPPLDLIPPAPTT